jgi:phosphoesterase RecJ-like protein
MNGSSQPVAGATGPEQALESVAAAVIEADRFLVTTHQGPDGDALGSLLEMHGLLTAIGKDSVMFLPSSEFPLPVEYRFLPLQEVFHEEPADFPERTLIFLDCGNADRMPVEWLHGNGRKVINIDHHHDNTRFGDINLVDDRASSTAEIVFGLAERLGVGLTPDIARALYVGVLTDTGRFSYDNTTPRTHRVAAALLEAGVGVADTYSRIYERAPLAKLKLLSRAIENAELREGGSLALTYVSEADYEAAGAQEVLTEGIIDMLRTLEGTVVAAVVRDRTGGEGPRRKVSLRSADASVDVSAIARAHGGGGHARAAGFSSDEPFDRIADEIAAAVHSQLG